MTAVPLLPDRSCGPCTVCCVALTIDDPELRKPQGFRCRELTASAGCGIYATRPVTCRAFFCGWRSLKWVRPTLRPDVSGVLIQLRDADPEKGGVQGVNFTLLNKAALKAEGLAESVAAAVNAGVAVFLTIPGPPGYTSASARVDAELTASVAARDKAGLLRVLTELHERGRVGKRAAIRITTDAAGQAQVVLGKVRRVGQGRLSR